MCWDRTPLTITVIAADLCVRSRVAFLSSSQSWQVSRQSNSKAYPFALHSVVYGLHTSCGRPYLQHPLAISWAADGHPLAIP